MLSLEYAKAILLHLYVLTETQDVKYLSVIVSSQQEAITGPSTYDIVSPWYS